MEATIRFCIFGFKEERMKQVKKWLPVLVFALIIFGLTGMGLTAEQKTYSSTEKRELQTRPKAKAKTIKNGKFQKKYEAYLSDQFPGRDGWVQLQTSVSRLLGKRDSNGVYFGKDHYLLERYDASDFEEEQIQANLDALTELVRRTKERADVKVMMAPTKTWVMQEKLPLFASTFDEQIFYDKLEEALGADASDVLVPVTDVLEENDDAYIYYRTDHHWTTRGAAYAYDAYVEAIGGDVKYANNKHTYTVVSNDFYGTTYARVHQAAQADEIMIYEPSLPLTVVYNMGEKEADSLYEMEHLETEDQYRVFTGGNQPLLEITGGEKNGRTLMLIKDSFANCMVPFLAEDFEKLVVVDLRQLNIGCEKLLDLFAPTDVLVLYNTVQFAKDRDLAEKCVFYGE